MLATTAIFVDLLVIGLGVSGWLILFYGSYFDLKWVADLDIGSVAFLLPAVGLSYLFGTVFDRIADRVFRAGDERIRNQVFEGDAAAYFEARRTAYTDEGGRNLLEYNRSRARLCRGWFLNSLLLAAAGPLFIWRRLSEQDVDRGALTFAVYLTLALLCFACWYAWKHLAGQFYATVKLNARSIRDHPQGTRP